MKKSSVNGLVSNAPYCALDTIEGEGVGVGGTCRQGVFTRAHPAALQWWGPCAMYRS